MPATIEVRQPAPHDIVHNPVHVSGLSTAFEGTVVLRLRDAHGDLVAEHFFTGGANGEYAVFAEDIAAAHVPATREGVLEVFEESARDGSPVNLVAVPIVFGIALVHEYRGFALHTVEPGDTLSKIAASVYGDASQWRVVHDANRHTINDPDLIHPGQVLRIPRGLGS